ncbi:Fe(2+) transporter permease subunit FeoB [Dongshaea marina]|uniref:Fe(2+) transporter permease subunit FeoB n=1 Tax=Dongshaea marina TaxID=2047966 RepID=UPI000D3E4EBD|nr:Fe(2+) transporter permease subunit FeoB [Dongshaea marina]
MREVKVALVGNPNCGKTTLFNALTGARQRVGNWSGVTVERKSGWCEYKGSNLSIVDLPGLYSLTTSNSESALDAQISSSYILSQDADCFVNIVDATNLERHLALTLQLLEMKLPVVVVLNMWDMAQKLKLNIDPQALAKELGCPVIPLCARKKQGIEPLKEVLVELPASSPDRSALTLQELPKELIEQHNALARSLNGCSMPDGITPDWLALRLLENDAFAESLLEKLPDAQIEWNKFVQARQIELEHSSLAIASSRYQVIEHLLERSCKLDGHGKTTITEMIDAVVLNRWLGLPIFLFVLYLMFILAINIGGALQPLFDGTSAAIFIDGTSYLAGQWGLPAWLTAILAQGVGGGINTLLPFIPMVGLLFLFLSILEDSGYMARAAFVVDRLMRGLGLPGHAFMPLLVGLGCNVPAIMGTRTLNRGRERLLTILMAPFISCGARLAIFAVFAAAFFGASGGTVVFLLYIIGVMVAILTGLIFKKSILQGDAEPFLMELPAYHLPQFKATLLQTGHRLKGFLIKAGKIILPVCILIGALNSVNLQGQLTPAEQSQNSILSKISQVATPIFKPIGVKEENWPATVGLVTGVLAKEVVVGTLNTLYTANQLANNEGADEFNLMGELKQAVVDTWDGLKSALSAQSLLHPIDASEADASMSNSSMGAMVSMFGSKIAAFSYLLFVLLYIPCVSAVGAIAKEANKGWALVSTLWSFSIAYCVALIFYQGAQLPVQPVESISWILGAFIYLGVFFALLKRNAHKLRDQQQIPIRFMETSPKACGSSSCCS